MFWFSSVSGRDTMVETDPGIRAPALNPVRRRGRTLSLSNELLAHVWGVKELPNNLDNYDRGNVVYNLW